MIKDKWLRVRFSAQEEQMLSSWASAYGENKSSFIRRLLHSLPPSPPESINPSLKLLDIASDNQSLIGTSSVHT
jgi:hypothetical protein